MKRARIGGQIILVFATEEERQAYFADRRAVIDQEYENALAAATDKHSKQAEYARVLESESKLESELSVG